MNLNDVEGAEDDLTREPIKENSEEPTDPLYRDWLKLDGVRVKSIYSIPMEQAVKASEYLGLICEDADGSLFRLIFAIAKVGVIAPSALEIQRRRTEGKIFFTEEEFTERMENRPLHPPDSIPTRHVPPAVEIVYVQGDATNPPGPGLQIIAHLCQDGGKWSGSFARDLARAHGLAMETYSEAARNDELKVGSVLFVEINERITVASVIALSNGGLDIPALEAGLTKLAEYALKHDARIHAPQEIFDTGDTNSILGIINRTLCNRGVRVYVYV